MNSTVMLVLIVSCISLFAIGLPVLYGALLPIIKPKLGKKATTYLYAFSAGFFMIIATVGFMAEASKEIDGYFETSISNFGTRGVVVASIVGSTILITLGVSLLVKYLSIKKIDGKNGEHVGEGHDHDHIIFNSSDYNPKSKGLALFFMLSHRVPGGLILGLLASVIAQQKELTPENIIFLVIFAVHIIPEELIMYYRQIEMGVSRWKAVRNSVLATMTLIPFMIIGASIGAGISEANIEIFNHIIMPIIQLVAASFLLFTAVIEFFPEFIHKRISGKDWYKIMVLLILGIVFAIIILAFHSHGGLKHNH